MKMYADTIAFVECCRLLNAGLYKQEQLAELTGVHIYTVQRWLRLFKLKRCIFVALYRREHVHGKPTAYYSWGFMRDDVPYPVAQTPKEKARKQRLAREKVKKDAESWKQLKESEWKAPAKTPEQLVQSSSITPTV